MKAFSKLDFATKIQKLHMGLFTKEKDLVYLKQVKQEERKMNEFNKRIKFERFLRAFIWSICSTVITGGCAAGIEILAWKHWIGWVIGLTASATALLVGMGTFIGYYLAHPITSINNALRIDKEFNTKEKIATSEYFKKQQGIIIEKQREDAEKTLKSLSPKNLPIRVSIVTLPVLVFGVGLCCFSSFAASGISTAIHKEIINDSIDNINNKTEEIINKIEDKINENSNATEDFKEDLNKILEDLEKSLENDSDVDSRQEKVDEAKEKINEALEEANSKESISEEQQKANEELANQVKEEMDELAKLEEEEDEFEEDKEEKDNLEKDKDENNKDDDSQENKEGEDSQQDKGDKSGSTGSKDGNGDSGSNSESNGGSSSGSSSAGQDSGGSGAGQGSGETNYRGDDHVYTEKEGDVEYKDVIDRYYQEANDDYKNSGANDDDFEDELYDYFQYLYGNDIDDDNNP